MSDMTPGRAFWERRRELGARSLACTPDEWGARWGELPEENRAGIEDAVQAVIEAHQQRIRAGLLPPLPEKWAAPQPAPGLAALLAAKREELRQAAPEAFAALSGQPASGPCPGCESLRRQHAETCGEVGILAAALREIKDCYPPGHAGHDIAHTALDRLWSAPARPQAAPELAALGDARDALQSVADTAGLIFGDDAPPVSFLQLKAFAAAMGADARRGLAAIAEPGPQAAPGPADVPIVRSGKPEVRVAAPQPAPELADATAERDRYRDALQRIADEDAWILGEKLGGGHAEEHHVRANLARQALGLDVCGCTECQVSLGLADDPEG